MGKVIDIEKYRTTNIKAELETVCFEFNKTVDLFENAPEFATDRMFNVIRQIDELHQEMQNFVLNN